MTDGFYQSMFLATAYGVVVVDAPPTIGHNLLRAIKEVATKTGTPSTVTHLVYSHFHADHIGASSIFGDDVLRVGHEQTRRLLLEAGDPNRPAPKLTFKDRHIHEFGTDRLELAFHGPNHHAGQHLHLRAEAADSDGGRRPVPGLGAVQESGRVTRYSGRGTRTRHRHGLPLDNPRRRPPRPPRSPRRRQPAATLHAGSGRKHQADVGVA